MAPLSRRVLLTFLVLGFGALLRAAEKSFEEEVRRLDGARVSALLKGDIVALEQLYSDDMVYIHANGRVDTKHGYLTTLRGGDLVYASLQYDKPAQIHVTGDTAIVTGRANIETKSKSGQMTKRVLTTTTVYVRTPSGWKIVSYQGTPAT